MTAGLTGIDARRARIGFWLLVGVIVALGIGKAVQADVLDPDCFWHMRVAEQLLKEGIRPIVDQLSYASIKEPWTPYSWLAELGMKWLWDTGGYRLTIIARALMVALTLIFAAMSCLELAHRRIVDGRTKFINSVVGTALVAFLSLPYLSFRPATGAIMLMAICAYLLLRDRRLDERTRSVWLVIPITALMVNLHLSAIIMPMWIGALLAGSIWERFRAPQSTLHYQHSTRRYTLLFIGTALACLCTPLLPGVISSAWNYQSQDVMVASQLITEMQPIYKGIGGVITLTILALFLFWAYRRRENLRAGEWLWVAVGIALMFRLGRFAPIAGLIAGPVLATTMPSMSDKPVYRKPILIVVAIALASFLFRIAISFPGGNVTLDKWLDREHLQFRYPCESADWVEANVGPKLDSRSGRLINEFNWGGYLEWRLGPQFQTLLDGRTQMFTADFWRNTLLSTDTAAKANFLVQQHADVAILPVGKSHFRLAVEKMGWQKAHSDAVAEVWLPHAPASATTAPANPSQP